MSEQYVSIPAEYIGNVFGNYDENIKALEKGLGVVVLNRGDDVKITAGYDGKFVIPVEMEIMWIKAIRRSVECV